MRTFITSPLISIALNNRTAAIATALLSTACIGGPSSAQTQDAEIAPASLVEAAKKEGRLSIYTVQDPESELKLTREFNRHYPFIKIDMLRLQGSQLLTRVKAEAASGRLKADLIAFSDTEESDQVAQIYADYTPPNATKYRYVEPGKNVWPRTIGAWTLCANTMTNQTPPKSWADLGNPRYKGALGEVTILTGGSGWTRSLFQRSELGREYWQSLANNKPRLYPSGVPMTDAMIRGEVSVGALVVNQALPKIKEGAPLTCSFGPEGVPAKPQVIGITKTAASPNAAQLYLNWVLSAEGQAFIVKNWYMFSALEGAPTPEGGEKAKLWFVDREQSKRVRKEWTDDWVQMFKSVD